MKYLPDRRAGIPPAIYVNCALLALIAGGFTATNLPGQTNGVSDHEARILEPEATLQATLGGGQSHKYQFHLRAGEYARVGVEQRSVNLAVACFGVDGQGVLSADSSVIGDAETAEVIAGVTGDYHLRITASEPNAPIGRYEIALRDVQPATGRHMLRIAAA